MDLAPITLAVDLANRLLQGLTNGFVIGCAVLWLRDRTRARLAAAPPIAAPVSDFPASEMRESQPLGAGNPGGHSSEAWRALAELHLRGGSRDS
jgi:hypothetical protein